jgi:hypothetical protein
VAAACEQASTDPEQLNQQEFPFTGGSITDKEPSVVGAAVVWLLSQPDGTLANGRTLVVDDVLPLLPGTTST